MQLIRRSIRNCHCVTQLFGVGIKEEAPGREMNSDLAPFVCIFRFGENRFGKVDDGGWRCGALELM
jgi:hypothetical protein